MGSAAQSQGCARAEGLCTMGGAGEGREGGHPDPPRDGEEGGTAPGAGGHRDGEGGVQLSLGTGVGEHSRGLVISAGRAQAGEAAAVGFTSQAQARAGQLPAASSTAAAEPRTPHNLLGGRGRGGYPLPERFPIQAGTTKQTPAGFLAAISGKETAHPP